MAERKASMMVMTTTSTYALPTGTFKCRRCHCLHGREVLAATAQPKHASQRNDLRHMRMQTLTLTIRKLLLSSGRTV